MSEPVVIPPGPGNLLPAGYLSTQGNQIVDQQGHAVKIAAVNWFGLESSNFAPQGLWAASYKSMMDQMVQLGFNAIRLPFSDQLFDQASIPNGIDFSKNPDLQGLTGLQIMDKIVDYAGQIGLKIVLDHHRSAAGSGPNADGLWYDSGYTDTNWISNWTMLAQHYAGNSTVIGADLANEPHGPATWGDGSTNDWEAAATRAGDAIQAVNSNWLVIVEGIESYQGQSTWWGGNLMGVASHPVTLTDANKVVYSPHDYPASVFPQTWFSAPDYPNNLPSVWNQNWGYIYQQDIAPVFLGEFGTKLQTTSDQQWLTQLVNYLDGNGALNVPAGQQGPSWAYWSWNPNSGDTGGILQDDWQTVNDAKVAAIEPAMYHIACFRAGTCIQTARGEISVETLQVGDTVLAHAGDERLVPQPVVWIGHRHVDCRRHPEPNLVWPVRIRGEALDSGLPARDLFLSPDHALFIDDVLIPVKCLVNGSTIVQVPMDEVTYYHVELPKHSVLLAEGLPVESYLDIGDRQNFANRDVSERLFLDFSARVVNVSAHWEAAGCAPLVVTGPKLDAVRRHVNRRAAMVDPPPVQRPVSAAA